MLDAVASGVFSPSEPDRYKGLVESLMYNDPFMVAADFDSYAATQRRVAECWRNPRKWWKSSAMNTAHVGWFSSDRTIAEYAREIWDVPVLPRAAAGS